MDGLERLFGRVGPFVRLFKSLRERSACTHKGIYRVMKTVS